LRGRAIKYGMDNIDTDVIIPGTYLKVHDYDELAKHAMEGLDPDFHTVVQPGNILRRYGIRIVWPKAALIYWMCTGIWFMR